MLLIIQYFKLLDESGDFTVYFYMPGSLSSVSSFGKLSLFFFLEELTPIPAFPQISDQISPYRVLREGKENPMLG
jgi:hypothetical protein